jgi:hypothetical protein
MPRKPDLASMQLRIRIPPRSPLFEHLAKISPALRGWELVALAQRGLIGGGGDPEALGRMAVALERMAAALERGGLAAPAKPAEEAAQEPDDPRLAALEGRWAGDDG